MLSDRVDALLVECYWRLHCLTCKIFYKVNCESCTEIRNSEKCPLCGSPMAKIGTMRFTCENNSCPTVEIRFKRSKNTLILSDEPCYGGKEKVQRQLERLKETNLWG